jgi:hypothetical protein
MEDSTNSNKYTTAGTSIDEVKRRNESSGLSYTEAMELIAKTGSTGTHIYKDSTNTDA